MPHANSDRPKRLGEHSPADLFGRGTLRGKVLKELSLWVVALLSAGAGAIGMQVGGSWAWSVSSFAVVLIVLMLARSLLLRRFTERAADRTTEALVAEQRARQLEADRRRAEHAARLKAAGQRPVHKPRANPYRKKGA